MRPWLYFLISAAFLFLIMRGGCGSHVMGHGHHYGHDGNPSPSPTDSMPAMSAKQVRDPVCGMTIDSATAMTSGHRGTIYFFCSDKCRS